MDSTPATKVDIGIRANGAVARGAPQTDARYDLLEPTTVEDPYPTYAQLRGTSPVYRDRRFFGCILTRDDDVVSVLKDSRVSSRRPTADSGSPVRLRESRSSCVSFAPFRVGGCCTSTLPNIPASERWSTAPSRLRRSHVCEFESRPRSTVC